MALQGTGCSIKCGARASNIVKPTAFSTAHAAILVDVPPPSTPIRRASEDRNATLPNANRSARRILRATTQSGGISLAVLNSFNIPTTSLAVRRLSS